MNLGEIFLEMTFDAGHRIVGHKGKCARLHGHTYRVEIRCVGPIKDPGFVVDFGDIKALVNEWDHRTLLWNKDPYTFASERDTAEGSATYWFEDTDSIVRLNFNPTAENMARYLAERMSEEFGLLEVFVTLWETPKASASAVVSKDQVNL